MTDIELLRPVPATLAEAIRVANAAAYGFAKHTDNGYWDVIWRAGDEYCFDRLLGWQAGGSDEAKYGRWAVPPSPWHVATDVPDDHVVIPTFDAGEFAHAVMERFDRIEARLMDAALAATANREAIQQQIDQVVKNAEKSALAILPLLKLSRP
jgi:hypothetical protein